MLDALWYCYRSFVQGADSAKPGTYATTPNWCDYELRYLGPTVRFAGVSHECGGGMLAVNRMASPSEMVSVSRDNMMAGGGTSSSTTCAQKRFAIRIDSMPPATVEAATTSHIAG